MYLLYQKKLLICVTGDRPINSFQDLAKQTDIKYGVVKSGFTMQFFEGSDDPTYRKIWEFMDSHRDVSMLKGSVILVTGWSMVSSKGNIVSSLCVNSTMINSAEVLLNISIFP